MRPLTEGELNQLLRRPDPALVAGRHFGAYELIAELGRGAMGVVLHARRTHLEGDVALKLLRNPDATLRARFDREARILARLRHRAIVAVLDAGACQGVLYIAFERVRGQSLAALVDDAQARGCLPDFAVTRRIFARVAEALAHCHARGLIHRDLKPENILIQAETGDPVLIDFGLLRPNPDVLGSESASLQERLTTTGRILGTPATISPEQVDPEGRFGKVGEGSDIWGLGATLCYALTGRFPYEEESPMQQLVALLSRPPPRARDLNTDVPEALDEIVAACLAQHERARPRAAELAAALREPGGALRPGWRQPRLVLIALGGILIALALLGLVALLLKA